MTATRSPRATPSRRSAFANASARRASDAKEIGSPSKRAKRRSGSARLRASNSATKPSASVIGAGSAVALAAAADREEVLHHARGLAGGKRLALQTHARLETVMEARLGHLAEALLVEAHGDRWLRRELLAETQRLRQHLLRRHDLVDETQRQAFRRLHHAAREREVDGAREAQDLPHDPGTRGAGDAGVDLGLPHAHGRMPDTEVGEQRHLERGARGDAV